MKRTISLGGMSCLLAVALFAQTAAPLPKPGAEHKKLEAFVGTWSYEGEAKKSVFGPAGKVTGTDIFEMLPGGFFIQHRWDEKNPLGTAKGLEVWGYDASKKVYTYNYFSSLGESGSGTVTVSGNTWSFTGSGVSYDGKPGRGRCTDVMTGSSFTVKCDASTDGTTWTPSFEGKWTKKS